MRWKLSKEALWYVAAAIGVATSLVVWRADAQPAWANPLGPTAMAPTGLVSHVLDRGNRGTRVVVIDSQLRAMGVYDIAPTGEIHLRSVRKLSADLQMLEFNSGEPSPEDIQSRLEQR